MLYLSYNQQCEIKKCNNILVQQCARKTSLYINKYFIIQDYLLDIVDNIRNSSIL